MLGEFCGSHPQPPISASRPVAARRTVRVLRFLFGNWYARAYLLVLSGLAFSPRDPEHQRDQDGHGTNAPRKSHCRASQAQDRQTRWRLVDPCHAAGLHAGVSVLGALINTALISLVVHAVRRRRSRA